MTAATEMICENDDFNVIPIKKKFGDKLKLFVTFSLEN